MNRASSSFVTPRRRQRPFLGIALSLHLLASSVGLTAALPAAAEETSAATEVRFVLESLPPHLDSEKLRAAIAGEIGATVTLVATAPSGYYYYGYGFNDSRES